MPGYELIDKKELDQITDLFTNSKILFRHSFDHLRNNIYKVKEFEQKFKKRMDVPHALGVTSGTAALRVALAGIGIKPGDEIITQSFTFVATVEAIIESRGVPVITEVDKTLNMDPKDLKRKITNKTKAIIVVHMLGTPARLSEIKKIADEAGVYLIEDTAWGCGGFYNKIPLGSFGDIGTYSFDFAKTMTTGEGGMVTFKNNEFFKKSMAWHDHGHDNNPEFPRWEDSRSSSGFNFRMNEMQGAVGIAQLEKLNFVVESQRHNSRLMEEVLKNFSLELRDKPDKSFETCDALTFFVDDNTIARKIRDSLLDVGMGTKILPEAITWHFAGTWEHMPELLSRNGNNLSRSFPQSLSLLKRSVSLPVFINMVDDFQDKVHQALTKVLK
tara:strand:+ start:3843 stop:5000 length:1158 start_codon:yes stop_codon:yes gene_type:complete